MAISLQVPLVTANLVTGFLASFFYGIFFILSVTSIYLLVERSRGPTKRGPREVNYGSLLKTPMFLAAIGLFLAVTGYWIMVVFRLFQGFILFEAGPLAFFADLAQLSQVVKTGFLLVSLCLGDAMIIYRLYIIWSYNIWIIIFPVCTWLGLVACGAGITYQFTQYVPGEDVFVSAAGRWITSDCVFTMSTNLYSTIMIGVRVWKTNRSARHYGGGSLMPVLITLVESAAIYTTWTLFFFVTYQTGSNIQFPAVDTWPVMAGIAFMLINVRVGLGWAQKSNGGQGSTRGEQSIIVSQYQRDQIPSYPPSPMAVNITRTVNRDDVYELNSKASHPSYIYKQEDV